jgi:hypothetical protein
MPEMLVDTEKGQAYLQNDVCSFFHKKEPTNAESFLDWRISTP